MEGGDDADGRRGEENDGQSQLQGKVSITIPGLKIRNEEEEREGKERQIIYV